ncbi:carboxymuconolactone decarboxylase family protein [Natronospira sp.]|uniref:carboxymuconolactone decarboxylase family protein n=1 Tax=Natronospira sp. TaxID=2024970 RepID=UPI0038731DAF
MHDEDSMMLNCRTVALEADELLRGEVSPLRAARLRLHILICGNCRRHVANLRALSELLDGHGNEADSGRALEELESGVLEALKEGGGSKVVALVGRDAAQSRDESLAFQESTGERLLRESIPDEERVQQVLREVREFVGYIPPHFRVYAQHPGMLEANWAKMRAVVKDGILPHRLREAIAILVSHDNGCDYCVRAHGQVLLDLGVNEEVIERMKQDVMAGDLPLKERALLVVAREANRDPHGASEERIALARKAGASDLEILEALGVMEIYTSINKFIDTLGIPLEA